MMSIMRKLRRLGRALRGHGGLEDKLVLLGAVGGFLFALLVVTLFVVQSILGTAQRQLSDKALPAEQQIARLESSMGAAFGRQAQVSSTVDLKQLDPLRDRRQVEEPLRQAARAIVARFSPDGAGFSAEVRAHAVALDKHVEAFLAADTALVGSVERRHTLQGAFEKGLGAIDADLRTLTQDAQAVSGILRLEYVLVLRGIADSLDHGGARVDLVRTAVLGDVRGALDDTAELANAVFVFDFLTSKIGLAASSDTINSIVANELPQIRARVDRLVDSLERRVGSRPEAAARMKALAARFADVVPRVMDDKRDDSLVNLRRSVVAEAAAAAAIRTQAVAAAAELTDDTRVLEREVATIVASSVHAQELTTTTARLVSAIVTLIGLCFCFLAARRIRAGIEELEGKNQHLTELKDNLEHMNKNLESLVEARTSALVVRDRAMQRVMDSMAEGLATVSLDGTVRTERSRAFTDFFGDPGQKPLWSLLFPDDPKNEALFACGFEQLTQEILPFEVSVDQLPRLVQRGERHLELDLRAVYEQDRLDAVLVVVSDVTERIGALRAERAAREEQKVIANLLRDRRGFQRSIEEIQALIETAEEAADAAELKRPLHTIKGNAAVLGFAALAERTHALEDELESEGQLTAEALTGLETCFRDSLRRIQEHLEHARDRIEVDPGDYRKLVEHLHRRADYDEIVTLVEKWQLEPIANIFTQLGGHARRLAEQLGKRVEVVIEANHLRVANEGFRAFCGSLVHAVRNAVDHGIETPEARAAAGKPEVATLRLGASTDGSGSLLISVADDGAGVDVERVRERGQARGLTVGTRSQVLEALFVEGVTTRNDVSELSGRGVGTSAIRAACRELGGDASIRSESGRGTELRCVLPATVLDRSSPVAA